MANETMMDIGGGFRLDVSVKDSFQTDCLALTLHLRGAGGSMRNLNQTEPYAGIRAVVISNEQPTFTCQDVVLTITTMSSDDIIYIGSKEGYFFYTDE